MSEIKETDTLVIQYVEMPVTDLAFRFLYRFTHPIEIVWQNGRVSSLLYCPYPERSIENLLTEFALDKWKDFIKESAPEGLPEEAKWLLDTKKVQLVPCEIIPK